MNYDKLLKKLFWDNNKYILSTTYKRYNQKKFHFINISDYIHNRFNDSDSDIENIYRIIFNIEERPVCPICGNRLKFIGKLNNKGLYNKTCSKSCSSKYSSNGKHISQESIKKIKQTKLERYGNSNFNNINKIKQTKLEIYGNENYTNKEKMYQTNLEKYGDEHYNNLEKIKQTKLEKYGDENYTNKEKMYKTCLEKYGDEHYNNSNKSKQTKLERYGDEHYFCFGTLEFKKNIKHLYGSETYNNIDKHKETCLERYGVSSYSQTDEFKINIKNNIQEINEKRNLTKLKNNTFNISKIEDTIYLILLGIFKNVKRQYKSDNYPYACDFYINNLDLYIELHFSWTHGYHPFNINNKLDIETLNLWKEKNNKYYNNAIYTWTDLDVRKFNIAKENKLNYLVFYNITEFNKWISDFIIEKHIKDEFIKIQNINFPKTTVNDITLEICLKEFNNLCKNLYSKTNQTNSYIIKYFHKSIIYAKKKNSLSPYNGWVNIKSNIESFKKYYKNRLIYSTYYKNNIDDFINGIIPEHVLGYGLTASNMYPFVSTFKPALAKYVIKNYLNEYNTIFDPFSGYSGRMLGTLACNKNYIGQDLCKDTVNESNEIYNFLKPYIKNTIDIKCKDSINETGEYECLFTCPPYNDLEIWPDIELKNYSCDEWIDICLKNYKCNKYVFVVDNTIEKYKKYIIDSIENKSHLSTNIEYIVII